jgi:hypothetical protein
MAWVIKKIDPFVKDKVKEIFNIYGVDYVSDSTYLGDGSYKEIHSTNIPGVVMVLTLCPKQFEKELMLLELLSSGDYPAMEYYTYERFDNLIIALGKKLFPIYGDAEKEVLEPIEKEVTRHLLSMLNSGLILADLQFMVDENQKPVFTDPVGDDSCWRPNFLEAVCKNNVCGFYVSVKK